jgi:hypothetical protein
MLEAAADEKRVVVWSLASHPSFSPSFGLTICHPSARLAVAVFS